MVLCCYRVHMDLVQERQPPPQTEEIHEFSSAWLQRCFHVHEEPLGQARFPGLGTNGEGASCGCEWGWGGGGMKALSSTSSVGHTALRFIKILCLDGTLEGEVTGYALHPKNPGSDLTIPAYSRFQSLATRFPPQGKHATTAVMLISDPVKTRNHCRDADFLTLAVIVQRQRVADLECLVTGQMWT